MDKGTVWFIRAALVYFFIGVTTGFFMLLWPEWIGVYKKVHAHFNLLGWMSMMVFGVSYHILPRFSGRPVKSAKLIMTQFWLANIGLLGMTIFWSYAGHSTEHIFSVLLGIFAFVELSAIYIFIYNIWPSVRELSRR